MNIRISHTFSIHMPTVYVLTIQNKTQQTSKTESLSIFQPNKKNGRAYVSWLSTVERKASYIQELLPVRVAGTQLQQLAGGVQSYIPQNWAVPEGRQGRVQCRARYGAISYGGTYE